MKRSMLVLFFWVLIFPGLTAQSRKKDNSKDIHFTIPIYVRNNSKTEVKTEKRGAIFPDQAVLKLPVNYSRSGKPTRLVYVAHGAGGGVTADSWYLNNFALVDTLLANGYAIFDVNGGASVENMGGPGVVQAAYHAYKYIRHHYHVDKRIFVVGLSMGGLSSSNFIFRHPNVVLAQGLFSAVVDLHGQAWSNPWLPTTRQSIANAFNFNDRSGNSWEEGKVSEWNPMFQNISVNGKDTLKSWPVPLKIWHGRGDKVVNARFSENFQRYILQSGGNCELREIESDDHGLSCGNPVNNHELILFFKSNDVLK